MTNLTVITGYAGPYMKKNALKFKNCSFAVKLPLAAIRPGENNNNLRDLSGTLRAYPCVSAEGTNLLLTAGAIQAYNNNCDIRVTSIKLKWGLNLPLLVCNYVEDIIIFPLEELKIKPFTQLSKELSAWQKKLVYSVWRVYHDQTPENLDNCQTLLSNENIQLLKFYEEETVFFFSLRIAFFHHFNKTIDQLVNKEELSPQQKQEFEELLSGFSSL